MKSVKILAIALGLAASSSLFAGPVSWSADVDGSTLAGATFSSTGGPLVVDTKNGVTFLGVDSGLAGSEIDLDESLSVDFDEAVVFSSLTLGLLFDGPEYGDLNEIAASFVNDSALYELRVTGLNTGEWYKNGVYQSDVTGMGTVNGGVGLWTVVDPFGIAKVTSVDFYPMFSAGPTSNSDFGLVAFTGTSVPDAGSSLALLGVALLGLAGFARRARR